MTTDLGELIRRTKDASRGVARADQNAQHPPKPPRGPPFHPADFERQNRLKFGVNSGMRHL